MSEEWWASQSELPRRTLPASIWALLMRHRRAGLSFPASQIAQKRNTSGSLASGLTVKFGSLTHDQASVVAVKPCPRLTRFMRVSDVTLLVSITGDTPWLSRRRTMRSWNSGPGGSLLVMKRSSLRSDQSSVCRSDSLWSSGIAICKCSHQSSAHSQLFGAHVPGAKTISISWERSEVMCSSRPPSRISSSVFG